MINQPPPEKGQSFFDMTDKEKKEIINAAADESNEMQAELMKKLNWKGAEPEGWIQSDCSQCIECKNPLFEKDVWVVLNMSFYTCFYHKCGRRGLLTILMEPLKDEEEKKS